MVLGDKKLDDEKIDYIENELYGKDYYDNLDMVLNMLDDEDELVRIEMIEALYNCRQNVIHEKLLSMLNDTNGLEKGSILLTLAYIHDDEPDKLEPLLLKNSESDDEIVKRDSYIGLLIIGKHEYLKYVLTFFQSSDYRIRCGTVNLLAELIENDYIPLPDVNMIENTLSELEKDEETAAVKSSIANLKKVLQI